MYRHVQETNKNLSLFCTSVQNKVTVLFFVHSIAWTGEQIGVAEQSQRDPWGALLRFGSLEPSPCHESSLWHRDRQWC